MDYAMLSVLVKVHDRPGRLSRLPAILVGEYEAVHPQENQLSNLVYTWRKAAPITAKLLKEFFGHGVMLCPHPPEWTASITFSGKPRRNRSHKAIPRYQELVRTNTTPGLRCPFYPCSSARIGCHPIHQSAIGFGIAVPRGTTFLAIWRSYWSQLP